MQALGQDVLEEAAHELLAGDAADPPPVGFTMLVADGDGLIVEADDTGVGDGLLMPVRQLRSLLPWGLSYIIERRADAAE